MGRVGGRRRARARRVEDMVGGRGREGRKEGERELSFFESGV